MLDLILINIYSEGAYYVSTEILHCRHYATNVIEIQTPGYLSHHWIVSTQSVFFMSTTIVKSITQTSKLCHF